MLKISAFYLVKQKVLFLKKYDLGRSEYQNKKALFTDPIFSDGFGFAYCKINFSSKSRFMFFGTKSRISENSMIL